MITLPLILTLPRDDRRIARLYATEAAVRFGGDTVRTVLRRVAQGRIRPSLMRRSLRAWGIPH